MKKVRAHEKGFSLIETIMALGIVAIASFALLKLMSSNQKSIKNIEQVVEAQYLSMSIRSLLSNEVACSNSLSGKETASAISLTELKDERGRVRYNVGESYAGGKVVLAEALVDEFEGAALSGTAKIKLKISKGGTSSIGGRDLVKSFDINIQKDASGKITSCSIDRSLSFLGESLEACTLENEGAIRYNKALKIVEFCNGSEWGNIGIPGGKLPDDPKDPEVAETEKKKEEKKDPEGFWITVSPGKKSCSANCGRWGERVYSYNRKKWCKSGGRPSGGNYGYSLPTADYGTKWYCSGSSRVEASSNYWVTACYCTKTK